MSAAGVLAAPAVGLGLAVAADTVILPGICFAIATILEVLALRAATGHRWPIPVLLPVMTFNLVGAAGYYFWDSIRQTAYVGARLPGDLGLERTGWIYFLAAAAATSVGGCLVFAGRPSDNLARIDLSVARRLRLTPGPLLLAGIVPLLLLLVGKGNAITYSRTYLYNAGPTIAVSVGNSLSIASIFLLAIAIFAFHGGARALAVLSLAGWGVVLFATATRQLALIPGALVLAAAIAPRPQPVRLRIRWILAAGSSTLVLLNLALKLRGGTPGGYGLSPFLAQVTRDPGAYFVPDLSAIFGNLLFAVPLAGFVAAYAYPITGHQLGTSLTPLLGGMTDWSIVSKQLRFNIYTPFNAIGELANGGVWLLLVYFAAAGALLAWIDVTSRRRHGLVAFVGSVGIIGLAALFSLDALQYNLRSTTRVLYYGLALLLVVKLARGRSEVRGDTDVTSAARAARAGIKSVGGRATTTTARPVVTARRAGVRRGGY